MLIGISRGVLRLNRGRRAKRPLLRVKSVVVYEYDRHVRVSAQTSLLRSKPVRGRGRARADSFSRATQVSHIEVCVK